MSFVNNFTHKVLSHIRWRVETSIAPHFFEAITHTRHVSKTVFNKSAPRHPFRESLHINLTSYPPRFASLNLTIKSLLLQSVRADKITLWIADDDIRHIPQSVLELCEYGLSIEKCKDIKSYKKLVPALMKYPESIHVTADDDLYFCKTWLETLCNYSLEAESAIVCHRAHRVLTDNITGNFLPYKSWPKEVICTEPAHDLLATTGAGVLYRPGHLHPSATDQKLISALAPTSDDLWFWWMARAAHTPIRTAPNRNLLVAWPDSQKQTLFSENVLGGANDQALKNLISHRFSL